jgi:hypothetical protein
VHCNSGSLQEKLYEVIAEVCFTKVEPSVVICHDRTLPAVAVSPVKSLIRVSQTDPLSELTTFDNELVLSLTFKATF